MVWKYLFLLVIFTVAIVGCWDKIVHEYSDGDCEELDASVEEDFCADIDAGDIGGTGQGCRPDPGYENFGGPCTENSDRCSGRGAQRIPDCSSAGLDPAAERPQYFERNVPGHFDNVPFRRKGMAAK